MIKGYSNGDIARMLRSADRLGAAIVKRDAATMPGLAVGTARAIVRRLSDADAASLVCLKQPKAIERDVGADKRCRSIRRR
jgi:hypothetical protein